MDAEDIQYPPVVVHGLPLLSYTPRGAQQSFVDESNDDLVLIEGGCVTFSRAALADDEHGGPPAPSDSAEGTRRFADVLHLRTKASTILAARRCATRTSASLHSGVACVMHDKTTLSFYNVGRATNAAQPADPFATYTCRPNNLRFGSSAYQVRDFFWVPARVVSASGGTKWRCPTATQHLVLVSEISIEVLQVHPQAQGKEFPVLMLDRITTRTDYFAYDRQLQIFTSINSKKPSIVKAFQVAWTEDAVPGSPRSSHPAAESTTRASRCSVEVLPKIKLDMLVESDKTMQTKTMITLPVEVCVRPMSLYDTAYVAVLTKAQEIVLFRLDGDRTNRRFHRAHVLQLQEHNARYALQVLDNLVVAHNLVNPMAFCFDIQLLDTPSYTDDGSPASDRRKALFNSTTECQVHHPCSARVPGITHGTECFLNRVEYVTGSSPMLLDRGRGHLFLVGLNIEAILSYLPDDSMRRLRFLCNRSGAGAIADAADLLRTVIKEQRPLKLVGGLLDMTTEQVPSSSWQVAKASAISASGGLIVNPVAFDGKVYVRRAMPPACRDIVGSQAAVKELLPSLFDNTPQLTRSEVVRVEQRLELSQVAQLEKEIPGDATATGLRVPQATVLREVLCPLLVDLRESRLDELTEDSSCSRTAHRLRYLRAVALEYSRASRATTVMLPQLQALILDLCTMPPDPDSYSLHQLLMYRIVQDSVGVAHRLLEMAPGYPPALQASLDMLGRLEAYDELIDVFLQRRMVLRAARAIVTYNAVADLDEVLQLALDMDTEASAAIQQCKDEGHPVPILRKNNFPIVFGLLRTRLAPDTMQRFEPVHAALACDAARF